MDWHAGCRGLAHGTKRTTKFVVPHISRQGSQLLLQPGCMLWQPLKQTRAVGGDHVWIVTARKAIRQQCCQHWGARGPRKQQRGPQVAS